MSDIGPGSQVALAEDAVARMQQRIKELEQALESRSTAFMWHKVTDRVPDNRRLVLVWGNPPPLQMGVARARLLGLTRFNPTRTGGRFDLEVGYRFFFGAEVTHWADIPNPIEAAPNLPPCEP